MSRIILIVVLFLIIAVSGRFLVQYYQVYAGDLAISFQHESLAPVVE